MRALGRPKPNLDEAKETEDDKQKYKQRDDLRKQKREEKIQKKARARARAASLGNAFSEIESLLGQNSQIQCIRESCTTGPGTIQSVGPRAI